MYIISFSFVAVIGIGYIISLACIFQKYNPKEKSCTASDIIKLTFASVTLYLAGSIFIAINARPNSTASISGSILEDILEYSTLNPRGNRWMIPDGSLGPLDQEKLDRVNTMIGNRISYMRIFDRPPEGEQAAFVITGTEDFPMNVVCRVGFPSDYHINLQNLVTSGRRYQVSCFNGEWG